MRRIAILLASVAWLAAGAVEQSAHQAQQVVTAVRAYRVAHEPQIIGEFVKLLSIPDVASDAANIARNATLIQSMLEARGFHVELLPTAEGRGPVVFGDLDAPGAKHTILFYAHYDGQPVDPSKWIDTKPFVPALRTDSIDKGGKLIPFPDQPGSYKDDWRIYARASGDDKAPIIGIMTAVDALRANHIPMAVNLKVIFEGEEEDSSPHLGATVDAHKNLFTGDVLITADGPIDQSGRPLIFFGNRGVISVRITVFGPLHPLHSGHYGNWAPNPAMRLAQLLASMKDADGRVVIPGFYDNVVPLGPGGAQSHRGSSGQRRAAAANVWIGGARWRRKKFARIAERAFAQYRRHGERMDRRAGQNDYSGRGDSFARHAAGEKCGAGAGV